MRLSPCDDAFLADPPHAFDHDLVLDLPPDRAFDLISSIEHERDWFPDFAEARWLAPAGPGARRDYRLTWLRLVEEFSVWVPGERMTFWVSEMSLPLAVQFAEDYRLSPGPAPHQTRLRWRVAYAPHPWLRPVHPLVRPWFVRDFRHAADALVAHAARLRDTTPLRRSAGTAGG
ncbi:MAG: SRPBCC family protein [Myxococcota bacterium]